MAGFHGKLRQLVAWLFVVLLLAPDLSLLAFALLIMPTGLGVGLFQIQGANDPRVKQAESDQIVSAMEDKGLPVTYVNFPDEGHGFARPENRLAFFAVMEGFLAECLGGRAEPIGDAFEGSTVQVLHGADYVDGLAEAVAAHAAAEAESESGTGL